MTPSPAGARFTKAEVLESLRLELPGANILPLLHFTLDEWRHARHSVLERIVLRFGDAVLIVRSSALGEDGTSASLAGRYLSVPDVSGPDALAAAIDAVIDSYGDDRSGGDRVLVQPMLRDVAAAGVALSRDPATGAPYVVVNYDDGGDTATVTSGRGSQLKTFVIARGRPCPPDSAHWLADLVSLTGAVEARLGQSQVDIEFAVGRDGRVFLLQARPLVARADVDIEADDRAHHHRLGLVEKKVREGMRPHPFLHGRRTVYGVMPDWNPAEIIGLRPRPLSLSVYRDLVTDAVWAYQRNNYGYKNLRSFPLLVHFHGLPYIDVRVSFNSFVPRDIDAALADKLVDHYIDRLVEAPSLHDKVEFEIVHSCYTLDMDQRLDRLSPATFSDVDRVTLRESLRHLTNRIMHPQEGLWRADRERLDVLQQRRIRILASDLDPVGKTYWLLEDCKRYGTLPFAGLARAGFVAVQMLQSMVATGLLSDADHTAFMGGLQTVSSQITRDFATLDRTAFLAEYGHLRPGTYDLLSPRYDETPDVYFDWSRRQPAPSLPSALPFALGAQQRHAIDDALRAHGLAQDVDGLFAFIRAGIESREFAKFVFTRNLSDALALFERFGEALGISREDLCFADIRCIQELYACAADPGGLLRESIAQGRERHAQALRIVLPPLITCPEDVWSFHLSPTEPNFITRNSATGNVCNCASPELLEGAIVAIENADPGYDWIFSHNVAGFVTAYGGVNSHMAIRACELGLPAVIGAGDALYRQWAAARTLRIDCANRRVEVLR